MNILKIIHGYPPAYNAGSEVYSQMLCHGLAKKHKVAVFSREENPFAATFSCRKSYDVSQSSIPLHLVNIPLDKLRYRYVNNEIDKPFLDILEKCQPDVVHIGHLNHLSTSLVNVIHAKKIPMIYTLHDFWLMCPRGRFIQRNSENGELWTLCQKQEDGLCATNCYSGYFSGAPNEYEVDHDYWRQWTNRRMLTIKSTVALIDHFIAPSHYLRDRYIADFVIPEDKISYLDYGFDLSRFKNRKRNNNSQCPMTFGYIGTHTPEKGIQDLIHAFGATQGKAQLIIWGRALANYTSGLHHLVDKLSKEKQNAIVWRTGYDNAKITTDVFDHVDCLVVPSIWMENSPLVIHEALQARIPVITADAGGMAEYVKHNVNGLLFSHRNASSLAQQMQRIISEPTLCNDLGRRGYLDSDDGNIPDIEAHVNDIENIYTQVINVRGNHDD